MDIPKRIALIQGHLEFIELFYMALSECTFLTVFYNIPITFKTPCICLTFLYVFIITSPIVKKLDDRYGGTIWNAIVTKAGSESGFLVQYKPGTCLEAQYEGYDFTIFQAPS